MTRPRWLATMVVLLALLAVANSIQAQTVPSRYFPLTGHTVRGEFLDFFEAHGGVEIFGYPITEEFTENGRQVQYFQHMRLETHSESPGSLQVRPGPIGEELGRRDPPIPSSEIPLPGDPNRRYFPETGHTVSYAFLNFFDEHGGVDLFGFPITEFKWENERLVQYFQHARMEWHPNLPPTQRVRLGDLGNAYAFLRLEPALLRPPPASLAQQAPQIVVLRPIASLQFAVTGRTGTQKLHVYVVDQQSRPVPRASVIAVIHFPTGDQELSLPQTNEGGYTAGIFELGQLAPGQRITLDVRVGFARLSATTRTSFLVWW